MKVMDKLSTEGSNKHMDPSIQQNAWYDMMLLKLLSVIIYSKQATFFMVSTGCNLVVHILQLVRMQSCTTSQQHWLLWAPPRQWHTFVPYKHTRQNRWATTSTIPGRIIYPFQNINNVFHQKMFQTTPNVHSHNFTLSVLRWLN